MFRYQGSETQKERLATGICRCDSQGDVHDLSSLLKNSRVADPAGDDINLSTRPVSVPGLGVTGTGNGVIFIFAVSNDYRVRIAPDGVRSAPGSIKHETLFHNADVRAAGEICVRDGIIAGLNDHSGSYGTRGKLETDPIFADAVLKAFNANSFPISDMLREELENLRII